jgi:putative transposase
MRGMPRGIRIIIPDICHHAIQRGNNRQDVFNADEDRLYYLEWARKLAQQYQVAIIGYCLMTNHIHLLVIPRSVDGMIGFMKLLAQRYTQYFNRRYQRTGKLWDNRYKIHPIDSEVYHVVLRYIEMNPVRAGVVSDGVLYPWSSASYHILGKVDPVVRVDLLHRATFGYREFFYQEEDSQDLDAIRTAVRQGKAWGRPAFLDELGNILGRVVTPRARGRPRKENK